MTQANEGTFKKKLLAVAVLAPAMALTACNSDDYTSADPATIASGVAVDGYLDNATVCVDANLNSVCDAGEASAITAGGGQWSIEQLSPVELRSPFVVNAVAGTTVDLDVPDSTIVDSFSLLAPPRSSVVSPITTIVQVESQSLLADTPSLDWGTAIEQARETVGIALGQPSLDVLNFDPVAVASANTSDSDFAARVHLVSRSITQRMIQLLKGIPEGVLNNSSFSAAQFAAVTKVAEKLAETKAAVDARIPAGILAQDLDTTTVDELLAEVEADPTATPDQVSGQDVIDASAILEAAQEAITAEIEEETGETVEPEAPTGSTGGTGADGGGQGVS